MANNRTTFLIGAGTPLDLDLPQGMIKPSTQKITTEVCKPYTDYLNENNPITIVQDIYDKLMAAYPPDRSNQFLKKQPVPNVHFEHLFHVLEMLYSYDRVWKGECHNPKIYPIFAPFTHPDMTFDGNIVRTVMEQFILRIMNIINEYDEVFQKQKITENEWYRNFYKGFGKNSDFFVLNYDTTIEHSIVNYEDGFESDGIQNAFKRFNPRRLFENPDGLSTVNHLHGCINYYFSSYKNANEDVYTYLFHDLYKYPDYVTVKHMVEGRGRSQPVNQSGENYYSSPIVTGLRKTDKLNCVPFDFYHANFTNCIIRNSRLVIAGYGFGDLYCNQLLERMHFLHGDQRRIVVITYWDIPKMFRSNGGHWLSQPMGGFLCRAAGIGAYDGVIEQLYENENKATGALYSDNGCLMVLPNGFKHAAKCSNEIESFLNS